MTNRGSALSALAHPTRLLIIEHLVEKPLAVVDLARVLPISRPAVSQHLRVLKDVGLVVDQPIGNRRVYRADPDALAALRGQLDRFWEKALVAFKTTVEEGHKE